MSNATRIAARSTKDHGAKRRHYAMLGRAKRGDVHAIKWLKERDDKDAKRKPVRRS